MIPQDKISDIQNEIKLLREENRRLHEKLKTDKTKNEDSDEVNFLNSSDLYKYIVRNINEGIWVIDTNGCTIFVTKRILDLLGYEWDEVIGKPVFNFIEPDSVPFIREKLQNRALGTSESFEQKLICKDGASLWFSLSASPVRNSNGKIMAFLGLFTDITAKKIAEEAQRESEARFKAVFQMSTEGIIIFDPKGKVLSLNDAVWKIYGFSSSEEMMQSLEYFSKLFDCFLSNGYYIPFDQWPAQRALKGESVRNFELRVIRKDTGQEWFFVYNAEPVFDSNHQLLQVVIFTRDVTDRKKAENELRRSRQELKSITDNSPDVIARFNRELKYIFINPYGEKVYGKTWEEIIGKTNADLGMSQEKAEFLGKHFEEAFRSGIQQNVEFEFDSPTFGRQYFLSVFVPEKNHKNDIVSILAISRDITDIKLAEQRIKENELILDTFFRNTPLGMIIYSDDSRYVRLNKIAADMYGMPEQEGLGKSIFDVLPPDLAKATEKRNKKVLELHKLVINEYTAKLPLHSDQAKTTYWQGFRFPVPLPGNKKGIGLVTLDITERVEAENQRKAAVEELQIREAQLDAFFANAPGILNLEDENFCYINTDNITPTYFGLTRETIKGKSVKDLAPEFITDFGEMLKKVIETGEPNMNAEVHSPVPGRPGEITHWRASYFRVPIGRGKWGIGLIGVEITDIKRTEQKLRENEQRFRTLADNISQLAWTADPTGKIQWVNKRWIDYTGINAEEMRQGGRNKIHHPEYSQFVLDSYTKAIQNGEYWEMTYPLKNKKGEFRWFLAKALPIRDDKGSITQWFGTNTDIHEQKLAEEKNKTLATELEATLESTPVGILVYDTQGKIVRSNTAANNLLQYPDNDKSEAISERVKKYFEIRDEQGRKMNTEELPAYRVALKGECVSNIILSLKWHEKTFWLIFNGAPLIFEGKQIGGVITMVDITSRKLVEEALKESEERFRTMADNISQFAWMADDKGWIFWYNKRWFEYTGTTFEEMQGWGWTKVHHPDHVERVMQSFKKAVETGENWEDTFPLRGKNGDYRWYLSRALPIRDKNGKIKRWFGTNTDVTDQRKAEENLKNQNIDLQKAKEKAEESDRFKTAFVANISHEIRTPMSGIMGFADLLQSPDLSAESQEKYIDAIISSGKRMLNIINDLINISKIEAGQVDIKHDNVDVNKLLDELAVFFYPEAQKKNIILKTDKKLPSEKIEGQADKTKLSQILINLVKNALKFTSEGFVEFGSNYHNGFWLFHVKDTGPGIKEKDFTKIFERFGQGDVAINSIQEGVGLGLAISKAYVEAMGGSIWVESNSAGSCFYFTIPYKEPFSQSSGSKKNEKISLPFAEVLIAEDEDLIFFYLNEVLKLNNIKAHRASNGQEAIKLLMQKPDIKLVLMDARMPVMDGFEATREIKKSNPHLPVIVLSALANEEDIQKAYDAGCVDYISKPVNKKELLHKISQHLASAN